jgi:hypothetical protein
VRLIQNNELGLRCDLEAMRPRGGKMRVSKEPLREVDVERVI